MVVATLKSPARGYSGPIIVIGSFYGSVSSDCRIYSDTARIDVEICRAPKAAVVQLSVFCRAYCRIGRSRKHSVTRGDSLYSRASVH